MNGLPVEVIVVLAGVAVVVMVILALRFGRAIGKALLIAGGLVAVVVGLLALLTQGAANFETARAATEAAKAAKAAATGQAVSSVLWALVVGGLATVTVVALGFGGFWWVRFKLAERRPATLPRQERREALPEPTQVVYIVGNDQDAADLADVDLSRWGW